jgi:hypothetical protein
MKLAYSTYLALFSISRFQGLVYFEGQLVPQFHDAKENFAFYDLFLWTLAKRGVNATKLEKGIFLKKKRKFRILLTYFRKIYNKHSLKCQCRLAIHTKIHFTYPDFFYSSLKPKYPLHHRLYIVSTSFSVIQKERMETRWLIIALYNISDTGECDKAQNFWRSFLQGKSYVIILTKMGWATF